MLAGLTFLPLLLQAVPARDFAPVEASTADARFVARIDRAPGQEQVPANMARFRLSVSERSPDAGLIARWHVLYPYDDSPARYLLADGGRAFVEIEEHFSESRAVLAVQTSSGRTQWTGAELGIPREALGGTLAQREWLDPARAPRIGWTDGAFGPCLELQIPIRDGTTRRLDASSETTVSDTVVSLVEPALQGALPVRCAVPYVQSVEWPRVARAGRPIAIPMLAHHATPGWTFLGFELEVGEDVLHLTPRSQAPDLFQAQVLSVFRTTATVRGLPVGRYTLRVDGWSPGGPPAVIDVLPEHLLAGVRSSGGFAGLTQTFELYDFGILRRRFREDAPPEFLELSAAQMSTLREKLAALPAKSRRASTKDTSDLFQHSLGFWSGETFVAIEVDDLAATEAETALIAALRGP
jgi:hypothetical protein